MPHLPEREITFPEYGHHEFGGDLNLLRARVIEALHRCDYLEQENLGLRWIIKSQEDKLASLTRAQETLAAPPAGANRPGGQGKPRTLDADFDISSRRLVENSRALCRESLRRLEYARADTQAIRRTLQASQQQIAEAQRLVERIVPPWWCRAEIFKGEDTP